MHLSVLQAVAAAGKNKDRPPHTIIDEKLKLDQDPTTSWNQRVSRGPAVDVSLLYEIIQLDRAAFVQRCRRLRQTGRADPLIALRAQLYELIQSSPDLDQVQVDTLKADVHYHTCTLFGKEMEVPTFSCFQKTTENSPFFTSHDTLVFQNRHASSDAQNKQKRQLTVMGSVDVLQLQLQGLLDMKAAGNVFEVKNRLWPEEEMKAEYRWAAHAQILVRTPCATARSTSMSFTCFI